MFESGKAVFTHIGIIQSVHETDKPVIQRAHEIYRIRNCIEVINDDRRYGFVRRAIVDHDDRYGLVNFLD